MICLISALTGGRGQLLYLETLLLPLLSLISSLSSPLPTLVGLDLLHN